MGNANAQETDVAQDVSTDPTKSQEDGASVTSQANPSSLSESVPQASPNPSTSTSAPTSTTTATSTTQRKREEVLRVFDKLPTEVEGLILTGWLDYVSVQMCSLVCKRWRSLLKKDLEEGKAPQDLKQLCSAMASLGSIYLPLLQRLAQKEKETKDTTTNEKEEEGEGASTPSSALLDENTCAQAAGGGHLEVLQWLRENQVPWDASTCSMAARGGHLELLKWARENGCVWNEKKICHAAAKGGHLDVLQWAKDNGAKFGWRACKKAAAHGHVHVIQWAATTNEWKTSGMGWRDRCAKAAAKKGQLEVIVWLDGAAEGGGGQKSYPIGQAVVYEATSRGHVNILDWLHSNGHKWDGCLAAGEVGNLSALKWAREKECPWDESTCAAIAGSGNLEMLKWAREGGCPWTASTCEAAARGGHLDLLIWARENGCPWDEYCWKAAVENEQKDVLSYVEQNGCPKYYTCIIS